jgi:hypothetical protein
VVGRGSVVDNDVQIGARMRIQTGAYRVAGDRSTTAARMHEHVGYLTAFTTVEDDVFVGPGVITTNDDTMARHGPDRPTPGATLRRACRVGVARAVGELPDPGPLHRRR